MEILKSDIVGQIRTAIDDIVPTAADSFKSDTDGELWQAVQHAVTALLTELPATLLEPEQQESPTVHTNNDGSGYIELADGFLRFIALQLSTWPGAVYELIEPGSDEEKRQRTRWGRGTPDKPRAMLDHDAEGADILRYWTAGKNSGTYDHTISTLLYISVPEVEDVTDTVDNVASVVDQKITCDLKEAALPMVIYRSAAIFFEGKKEPETAEKFRNI